VLASVVAGRVIGRRLATSLTPGSRVLWLSTWKMAGFLLNGFVFDLIGLELPSIVRGLESPSPLGLLGLDAAVAAVVVVGRIAFVLVASLLPGSPRRTFARRDPHLAWRRLPVAGWAGPRRAVPPAADL